jgi:hypothetical protein
MVSGEERRSCGQALAREVASTGTTLLCARPLREQAPSLREGLVQMNRIQSFIGTGA